MRGKSSTIIPLLLFMLAAAPVQKTSRSFDVPGHGQIQLSYPKTWEVQPPAELKLPPNIKLESDEGQDFMVEITPLSAKDLHADSPEGLRKIADTRARHDLLTAKEKKADYQELKGDSARGLYYSLTDKSDDPGDFKYMTAAIVTVGDLVLNVTILDNDPARPQRAQALEMLKSAKQLAAGTQPAVAAAPAKQFKMAAANGKFNLLIDQRDFQVLDEQTHGDSKTMMAANEDGWAVSIFLEPAAKPGDARAARAFYEERMKRSPLKRDELKFAGDAKKATTQYTIKDLDQKNINVYMVQDGIWVDVHISKTEFELKDQKILDDLVASIRIEPIAAKK